MDQILSPTRAGLGAVGSSIPTITKRPITSTLVFPHTCIPIPIVGGLFTKEIDKVEQDHQDEERRAWYLAAEAATIEERCPRTGRPFPVSGIRSNYGLWGEDGNGIKQHLNWDTTHHEFDEQRSEWIVDVDGLGHLAEVADEYDSTVATEPDDNTLFEAVEHIEKGAKIDVEYVQKNGNGTNTKTGEVRSARGTDDDALVIRFIREDGQTMRVKPDVHGDISLFTGGHHPFVGIVTSLAIEG